MVIFVGVARLGARRRGFGTKVQNGLQGAECIIEILSRSDRPIILVFRHQRSLRKSEGVTPNGGTKYKGVAIFHQYAAISRKRS